jgi:hypothetical protein
MYYFELADKTLHMGFGTPENIVSVGFETYGTKLIGVYKDNGNAPFIPIWQIGDVMRVREYDFISNGYHEIMYPFYVATMFKNPVSRTEDNLLYVWFCVPGPKDYEMRSKGDAICLLHDRFLEGHRSLREVRISSDIICVKGAIESLVKAIVVNTVLKDKSLLPNKYRKYIYKVAG